MNVCDSSYKIYTLTKPFCSLQSIHVSYHAVADRQSSAFIPDERLLCQACCYSLYLKTCSSCWTTTQNTAMSSISMTDLGPYPEILPKRHTRTTPPVRLLPFQPSRSISAGKETTSNSAFRLVCADTGELTPPRPAGDSLTPFKSLSQ